MRGIRKMNRKSTYGVVLKHMACFGQSSIAIPYFFVFCLAIGCRVVGTNCRIEFTILDSVRLLLVMSSPTKNMCRSRSTDKYLCIWHSNWKISSTLRAFSLPLFFFLSFFFSLFTYSYSKSASTDGRTATFNKFEANNIYILFSVCCVVCLLPFSCQFNQFDRWEPNRTSFRSTEYNCMCVSKNVVSRRYTNSLNIGDYLHFST